MKNLFTTIIIICGLIGGLKAQDVDAQLGEARSAYKSGDLQGTRFALQQALNEIDRAIGAEILKILPEEMGNMKMVEDEDNITATSMGYLGLFVNRNYQGEDGTNASVVILSDSPYLSGINALLALPVFGGDPNQKRIRVNGYRALLQRSEDESGVVTWDVQLPFGSNLLTFSCSGISSEKAVTDMAATIPVDQIARFAQ